jgi:hypothetical protein
MNAGEQTGTIYVAGNVNVDLILGPLEHWPRIGTETILPHYELRVGGQAGNTGLAIAALRARHRVVANMGSDPLGDWLRSAFPDGAPNWERSPAAATVTVGLLHPSGERTFFTSVGHLAGFAPEHVLAQLPERAAPGDVVLICGVFLSPLLVTGGRQLLQTLVGRGFATALDTGWPDGGWDAVRPTVESWLALVDTFCSMSCVCAGRARVAGQRDGVGPRPPPAGRDPGREVRRGWRVCLARGRARRVSGPRCEGDRYHRCGRRLQRRLPVRPWNGVRPPSLPPARRDYGVYSDLDLAAPVRAVNVGLLS